ncbi:hypothetical protein D3C81_1142630 [compost metagenome]
MPQHRQHALALPGIAVTTKTHDPVFPDPLVLVQLVQRGQRQVESEAGQGGLEQALRIRLGAGFEPGQQVMRLLGREHRVLVGQVHAAHITGGQFGTNHLCLVAVAHEDGDVRGQAWA